MLVIKSVSEVFALFVYFSIAIILLETMSRTGFVACEASGNFSKPLISLTISSFLYKNISKSYPITSVVAFNSRVNCLSHMVSFYSLVISCFCSSWFSMSYGISFATYSMWYLGSTRPTICLTIAFDYVISCSSVAH